MFQSIRNTFLKEKLLYSTDIHSHLLPELDDGSTSIEMSLQMVKNMKQLGYKKLIVTPHIMQHKYPNTSDIIRTSLFELRGYLKVENINIDIEAAAEYFCDCHFLELLRKNDILMIAGKYVLFELPYKNMPSIFEEVVETILQKNLIPLLAHPERCRFLTDPVDYRSLKKMGILFQIDINSLGGYYGKDTQKKSLMLAQKGMVDFVGSDVHHEQHVTHLKENLKSNNLEMLFRNNKILNDKI